MNILNKFLELFQKSKNLFIYFLNMYSKPLLRLISIDKTRTVIHYASGTNGVTFSKHVKELFESNHFISYFNSSDAAQIGYLYGIWIQSTNQ